LSGRTVLRETGIVEVQLEQEPAVSNIDQSAFGRPRNFDFSFLKKQWRARPHQYRPYHDSLQGGIQFPGALMKTIRAAFALPVLAMALASMPAMAQDHPDNHTYKQHNEWKTGAKIQQEDWNRGDKVDYQQNHLRRPPAGHEWRQIDGNYVMAKQDGTIVSVRQAPHNH
jgi:Ni/Co efflux regulator RcnB